MIYYVFFYSQLSEEGDGRSEVMWAVFQVKTKQKQKQKRKSRMVLTKDTTLKSSFSKKVKGSFQILMEKRKGNLTLRSGLGRSPAPCGWLACSPGAEPGEKQCCLSTGAAGPEGAEGQEGPQLR